jgi:hypothetical protein
MKYILLLFCLLLISCATNSKRYLVTCIVDGKPAIQVSASSLYMDNGMMRFLDTKTRREVIMGGMCFAMEVE